MCKNPCILTRRRLRGRRRDSILSITLSVLASQQGGWEEWESIIHVLVWIFLSSQAFPMQLWNGKNWTYCIKRSNPRVKSSVQCILSQWQDLIFFPLYQLKYHINESMADLFQTWQENAGILSRNRCGWNSLSVWKGQGDFCFVPWIWKLFANLQWLQFLDNTN